MNLEVLVEEPSAEAALRHLIPKIVGEVPFSIRVFQGKSDLLRKLPQRLAGYASWVHLDDTRIVVLVDRDREDCLELKRQLEEIAAKAGLSTRATLKQGETVRVLLRIAIEELEAWLLGDPNALHASFPRISSSVGNRERFRDPDTVTGAWEALEHLLQREGYQRGGLEKVRTARLVAGHMDVDRNASHSFGVFRDGLRRMAEVDA